MLTYVLAQICQIKMAVDHLEKDTVTLVPDILQMQEERDGIPIYTIVVWRFKYLNMSNPNSGIVVEILLKRKLMSELMTTYFPTILLVAITFATSQSWGKVYIKKNLIICSRKKQIQFDATLLFGRLANNVNISTGAPFCLELE